LHMLQSNRILVDNDVVNQRFGFTMNTSHICSDEKTNPLVPPKLFFFSFEDLVNTNVPGTYEYNGDPVCYKSAHDCHVDFGSYRC